LCDAEDGATAVWWSKFGEFVGIIKDLAREHRLARFRIGYFYSEVGKDYLRRKITAFAAIDGRPPLDPATLGATDRVVAPAIRTLFETTYLAGLRKAGMPEE